MKVIYKNINSLKEYEANAKKHPASQIDQIVESIKEFGFNDPIATDENGVIIEGHGRLKAAKKMGLKEVPTIELEGLSEEQKRAYILIHNQLTTETGFNIEKLEKEIQSIQNIDMEKFGFNIEGLEEAGTGTHEDAAIEQTDEIKIINLQFTEEQFQLVMAASDLIERSNHELHTFGNPNKRNNLIFEIIYKWCEKRGLL